jgi:hypothetical protein
MGVRGVRRVPFRGSGFVKLVDDVDLEEGVKGVSPREFKRKLFPFLIRSYARAKGWR